MSLDPAKKVKIETSQPNTLLSLGLKLNYVKITLI